MCTCQMVKEDNCTKCIRTENITGTDILIKVVIVYAGKNWPESF